jgi:hypothetical protein
LWKPSFSYFVIHAKSRGDAEQVVEMLSRNDRCASNPEISEDTVMVHMRVKNDAEDLLQVVKALKEQFPENTEIIPNPTYHGILSSETKRKYKEFITPALAGYIATVIGVFMLNWNNALSPRVLVEAFIGSIFPAAAAIFLKIYEKS